MRIITTKGSPIKTNKEKRIIASIWGCMLVRFTCEPSHTKNRNMKKSLIGFSLELISNL